MEALSFSISTFAKVAGDFYLSRTADKTATAKALLSRAEKNTAEPPINGELML